MWALKAKGDSMASTHIWFTTRTFQEEIKEIPYHLCVFTTLGWFDKSLSSIFKARKLEWVHCDDKSLHPSYTRDRNKRGKCEWFPFACKFSDWHGKNERHDNTLPVLCRNTDQVSQPKQLLIGIPPVNIYLPNCRSQFRAKVQGLLWASTLPNRLPTKCLQPAPLAGRLEVQTEPLRTVSCLLAKRYLS